MLFRLLLVNYKWLVQALVMSREKMVSESLIVYRDCVLAAMLYTEIQDGVKMQGYGFITIYMGLSVSAHCTRNDQWLSSVDAAIAVGKLQIDLDYLKLKHCIAEYLR